MEQLPEPAPLELTPPTADEIIVGGASAAEELTFRTGRDLKSAETARQVGKLLRDEGVLTHLHTLIVVGMYVVAFSAAAMFLVLIWHYVTPYVFLTPDQLSSIKRFLFSSSLGAGISGLAKKHLGSAGDT